MTKLSAADLMVICDTLYKSLNVVGNSKWAKETRELTNCDYGTNERRSCL
jgi:hypothetical protein